MILFDITDNNHHPIKDPHDRNQDSAEQKPLFSLGIIADVQYADIKSAGNRYYSASLGKLEKAVSVFMKDSVDLIINLGDLIEKNYDSYKPVLNILYSSGIKTCHITGNHDYSVDSLKRDCLPVLGGSGKGYYSFVRDQYRLIFINGNEISTYGSYNKTAISEAANLIGKLKNMNEINAIEWNGGISGTQLDWINNQLAEAAGKSEKAILFCHFPIAPNNIHNLLNYKEVYSTLQKYNNVVAWFSGHNHEGNYTTFKKIHFVTFKGMVETADSNSFAVVEVYDRKIVIRGYGRENSLLLNF